MILAMIAETFLHPGMGQTTGAVDLPVMRESTTKHPVIFGSSLKGSLLELAKEKTLAQYELLFGKQDNAGQLLIGDARLLLLPVRCLTGTYKWVTCPLILERLSRDATRAGLPTQLSQAIQQGQALGVPNNQKITLEERQFQGIGNVPDTVIDTLKKFIPEANAKNRLKFQLVILHDDDFAWFAEYGLQIQAHNQLEEHTKQSKNLWFEENLPPDTVLYSVIGERETGKKVQLKALFPANSPFLRVGGDETTGKGWVRVQVLP